MGKTHVYIKPFIDDAGSGYVADWIEVTDDVLEIGQLQQQLDNTEQDVGIFRNSNLKLKLRNDHGKYGTVGTVETLFKYKRGDSLVRITWEPGEAALVCGFFELGFPEPMLSTEEELFEGLLNDTATTADIEDQTVDFQVLGYESLLGMMSVPYASISNGNTFAQALYTILNQSPLNARVTVSSANISTDVASQVDTKTEMEAKTALDVVKLLLAGSNSVLYIRNNVLYVAPRDESADLEFSFYGQGSIDGIENILGLDPIRTGENRLFNYVTWKDVPSVLAQDSTSVTKYGVRRKELDIPYITDATRRGNLATAWKDEFRNPKREFNLVTYLTPDIVNLFLLDKVMVDYPAPFVPLDSGIEAIYGIGEYAVDYYADSLFALTIESTARFKIMNRKIDFKSQTAMFGLREV